MRNTLIMKYPASWHGEMWRGGIPAGNGLIGALIYGGIAQETVMISHARLWRGGHTPPMPDVSDRLPVMRRLLAENNPVKAERVMQDEFERLGYRPETASPLPLCDLVVSMRTEQPFREYRRELDMEKGEITVSWLESGSRIRRALFVSRASDTVNLRIYADDSRHISAGLWLALHDTETQGDVVLPKQVESYADGEFLRFAARNGDGTDFGALARIMHNGTAHNENGRLQITEATEITLLLKVFVSSDRTKELSRLKMELSACNPDYEIELLRHCALHTPLYKACMFDLYAEGRERSVEELLLDSYQGATPLALLEKLWSMGRYLLISASREGGLPCHLYGLWLGDWRALWAFNMFNINLQMIYWQALSGNMPELLLPVFEYLDAKVDDFRENARKTYGCHGIFINSVSTPESGLNKCLYPHILHWTGAAAWLSQHYFAYWLHTGDREFLKTRALPFMVEAAQFYEDFVTISDDGMLVFSPSNSPENTPENIKAMIGRDCEVTINATMDFALLKELLTNLLNGSKMCGLYQEKLEIWEDLLQRIPPYQINGDGAMQEWMHPYFKDNYEHRHLSHLYPLFPGTEITRENNPELYEACLTAVMKRKVVGLKDQSGWSLANMANIFARIGMGQDALECIDLLSRTNLMPNLMTIHNDWRRMGAAMCGDMRLAPVQIDANMGITAAMQEMVLYSTSDSIFLMQAVPEKWIKGKVGPLSAIGGIDVQLQWDHSTNTGMVVLRSKNMDLIRTLILPDNMKSEEGMSSINVVCPTGKEVILKFSWERQD